MNLFISTLLLTSAVFGGALPGSPTIKGTDLQQLTGRQWVGTLTYLDYGRNKKVSIPVTLDVTRSTKDNLTWTFTMRYPDEPKANNPDEVAISKDGRTLDGETVVERMSLPAETVKIVTEKSGTDNDKPALFRFTYTISLRSFSIRKEVRYEGTSEFFERNEYQWKR